MGLSCRSTTPVRRTHINVSARLRVDPAAENMTTRKRQYVDAASVYYGQLQIKVEGCGGYLLPFVHVWRTAQLFPSRFAADQHLLRWEQIPSDRKIGEYDP